MNLKKVAASLKNNKRFLTTAHTNPEGDALGAELAFSNLLRSMGKHAIIVNEDAVPSEYSFLPGIDNIKKFRRNSKNIKFDCLVVLDCSDLRRCGEVAQLNKDSKPVINIDHHISNDKFGDINWVEPYASSCSEMIYKLYKKLRVPIDRDAAMCLYVGILTDTGSFRYVNTTSFTHKAVAELLKHNLDVTHIYKLLYGNIPFRDIQLLTKILPAIKRQAQGKIAWFQIKRSLLEHKKLSFDLTENILSFARTIKDIEVVVLFKENLGTKDEIRVNFRSQGKVDVNKIAKFFGGGGHKTASGATVKGKLEQVRNKVLAKIRESLK